MSELVPRSRGEVVPSVGAGMVARDRRTGRTLTQIERHAVVRAASVQAHTAVQAGKLQAVDQLTREAMTGQAMLSRWAATLAQGDAFMADDLRFFADVARMGKGEIIASTIEDLNREGRR